MQTVNRNHLMIVSLWAAVFSLANCIYEGNYCDDMDYWLREQTTSEDPSQNYEIAKLHYETDGMATSPARAHVYLRWTKILSESCEPESFRALRQLRSCYKAEQNRLRVTLRAHIGAFLERCGNNKELETLFQYYIKKITPENMLLLEKFFGETFIAEYRKSDTRLIFSDTYSYVINDKRAVNAAHRSLAAIVKDQSLDGNQVEELVNLYVVGPCHVYVKGIREFDLILNSLKSFSSNSRLHLNNQSKRFQNDLLRYYLCSSLEINGEVQKFMENIVTKFNETKVN